MRKRIQRQLPELPVSEITEDHHFCAIIVDGSAGEKTASSPSGRLQKQLRILMDIFDVVLFLQNPGCRFCQRSKQLRDDLIGIEYIDYDRAEMVVLRDFRSGKLGKLTLDPLPEK